MTGTSVEDAATPSPAAAVVEVNSVTVSLDRK